MLQNHQKLALVSLGLLAYQSSLGNKMKEGDYTVRIHKRFSMITWGTYMTSAIKLSCATAKKYDKRISSIKIHRWLSHVILLE